MNPASRSTLGRIASCALTVALFLFVVGTNCDVLNRYGSDMPNMDQWDAEGAHLLIPWLHHGNFIRELFAPQNEHRVVLTKLQNWALTVLGGQWDARVQSLVNACLHGLIAVGLWQLARRTVRGAWLIIAYLTIALLYGLPLSWQNLLAGFHSQQYWLILLSAAAIALLPFARVGSARWWCGIAAAILALGAMASGFLAAAVVLAMIVVIGFRDGFTASRSAWITALFALVAIAVGWFTHVEVSYHEPLKAKSAHDFIFTVVRALEWPLGERDYAAIALWAPWAVVTVVVLRPLVSGAAKAAARPASESALVLSGLGFWVWLQLFATAYGRGAGAPYPSSRYMDTLMFGAAVNVLALGWVWQRELSRGRRILVALVAAGWFIAFGAGTYTLTRINIEGEMPRVGGYFRGCETHFRAYLATNDPAELVAPIPYLDAASMVTRAADPDLRALLPQSVRPAMAVTAQSDDKAFLRNFASQLRLTHEPQLGLSPETQPLPSRPTWGSYNERRAANVGSWSSAPLTAPIGGWLKFETAGQLGEPGVSLELHDAATDAVVDKVVPSKVPGVSWRSVYVRAPRRPFTIVATDSDPTRWLAFSAPVEMSSCSYWSWRVVKNGWLLAACAAVLAALATATLAANSFATRRETERN
jgi:hypothetical protein